MLEWQLWGSKNKDTVAQEYKARGGKGGRPDLGLWNRVCIELCETLGADELKALEAETNAAHELDMAHWRAGVEGVAAGNPELYEE